MTDYTTLITSEELAPHLGDPDWAIVDCRFELGNPDVGYAQYLENHIPGAVYAHINRDLSGPITPETGRHPLPDPTTLFQTLSRLGIGPGVQVVAYDSAGGSFADRLWWLLRLYSFDRVAVLNGGFPRWMALGLPTTPGAEERAPRIFQGILRPEMLADEALVMRAARDPAALVVDARAPERYRGDTEPIDPVAGHIPGAVNRFYGLNLDENGMMKSPEVLRREFEQILGETTPENAIFYCGSGITGAHHVLAMEYAGLRGSKLYAGSWSQWIRDPDRPVATGDEQQDVADRA